MVPGRTHPYDTIIIPPNMTIIDGKKIADVLLIELRKRIARSNRKPGLAVLLVGNDAASETYVRLKKQAAESLGILFSLYRFPNNVPQSTIEETIDWLNTDDEIDGILIQLPLPDHCDQNALINRITPGKDADGFHRANLDAYLAHKDGSPAPGLIQGILALVEAPKLNLTEKRAAIFANSETFAQPMEEALRRKRMTVKTHIKPSQAALSDAHEADVVIVALGKPGIIKAESLKKNAIVVDVGFTRKSGQVFGDIEISGAEKTDISITPVPGGVGPMTVAMLMKCIIDLHEKQHGA